MEVKAFEPDTSDPKLNDRVICKGFAASSNAQYNGKKGIVSKLQ
jgi:hypothetical protein